MNRIDTIRDAHSHFNTDISVQLPNKPYEELTCDDMVAILERVTDEVEKILKLREGQEEQDYYSIMAGKWTKEKYEN